jgi:catechol 2,3-dioxygenase-like lactoylglutathione lyase family enzyme
MRDSSLPNGKARLAVRQGSKEAAIITRREDLTMLDHLGIQCSDVAASAVFYDAVLATLGAGRIMDFGEYIGYGIPPKPDFWLGKHDTGEGFRESHIAFAANDRATVQAFFDAAVAHGAEILHEPRVWPEYHPNYFGGFVRDPDGNNVEAVCHFPEEV